MSEDCELCVLGRINHVFYNCDDFIIMACDSCNVPMIVPYEHIDPTVSKMLTAKETNNRRKLIRNMQKEIYKVAYSFFDGLDFYIDKKENKIPNHMHWHARKLTTMCGLDMATARRINWKTLKRIGEL